MTEKRHPVAEPIEDWVEMSKFWHLTSSLRGGTPAMREAGRIYLPQEPKESTEAYQNRLERSVLTNLYKKASDKLVGKPLKKPIKPMEDIPREIMRYWDDIDNQGTNVDVFARNLLEAAVDDGVAHVLVDYTDISQIQGQFPGGSLTLEQERSFNVRPYARLVRAADLIGWKWDLVNNRKVLTQIRIKERVKVDVDEFTQEWRNRVRVIEPFLVRVYEEQIREENGTRKVDWVIVESKITTMQIVPLVTFYTNRKGFMKAEPLMLDVAYLNVAHWQSDSDQRNILHIARVPILFASGFGEDDSQITIEIGSNTFVKGPKGANLEYVEHSGKGIEAGAKDLADLEERIYTLSMELMIKRPTGNFTATARALDQVESDSVLGLIARELENALEEILDLFGMWMGLGNDSGGNVEVFKDFGIEADSKEVNEFYLKARAQGDISQQTFWKEIKRRGLLSDDFDPRTEIDLLDVESYNKVYEDNETGDRWNTAGEVTSEVDGHTHTLLANGRTSVAENGEGVSHDHTWDELGIRTNVEAGHSHMLVTRGSAGTARKEPEPEPAPVAGGASSA